jgi:hypothetical protein
MVAPQLSAFYGDAHLKVKRAKKHIADFTAAIIALEDTCTATVEHHAKGGQSLKHEIPEAESALEELSLIAGDALHNLRSSLDFAWYSTISRCLPDWLSENTKFPVRETWQNVEAALHGIEVDTRCPRLFECIMTHIQPYKGGKNSVIWALHNLDISDKHLLLLRLDPVSHAAGIAVRDVNGELHQGASMATRGSQFSIDFYPGFKIEDTGKLSVAVTFQEAGIFESVPAESLLSSFGNFTLYTVQLLENI